MQQVPALGIGRGRRFARGKKAHTGPGDRLTSTILDASQQLPNLPESKGRNVRQIGLRREPVRVDGRDASGTMATRYDEPIMSCGGVWNEPSD